MLEVNVLKAAVKVPEILRVPLLKVRKAAAVPSTTMPCTVKLLGFSSSTETEEVPLLMVRVRILVVAPEPPKVLLAAPVKVIFAPAALALVLKLSVPLLVRSPPTERVWAVTVPVAALWKAPPWSIVTNVVTPSVRAVTASYCKTPPVLMVRLYALAAVSIVTVDPEAIVTLSPAVGTTPPDQVAGLLQLPAPGFEVILPDTGSAWPLASTLLSPLAAARAGG